MMHIWRRGYAHQVNICARNSFAPISGEMLDPKLLSSRVGVLQRSACNRNDVGVFTIPKSRYLHTPRKPCPYDPDTNRFAHYSKLQNETAKNKKTGSKSGNVAIKFKTDLIDSHFKTRFRRIRAVHAEAKKFVQKLLVSPGDVDDLGSHEEFLIRKMLAEPYVSFADRLEFYLSSRQIEFDDQATVLAN